MTMFDEIRNNVSCHVLPVPCRTTEKEPGFKISVIMDDCIPDNNAFQLHSIICIVTVMKWQNLLKNVCKK